MNEVYVHMQHSPLVVQVLVVLQHQATITSNTFENSSNYLAVAEVEALTLSSIHTISTHQQSFRGGNKTLISTQSMEG
jgi:hypothetical protein